MAIVLLNYNSLNDLRVSVPQMLCQAGICVSVIIVDNASRSDGLACAIEWVKSVYPDAVCGAEHEVLNAIRTGLVTRESSPPVLFVQNKENRGYSAGNNTGLRIAAELRADAALVANPDMRVVNTGYVRELASELFGRPDAVVAGSRIVDLDGKDQNPLREATFWEELTWVRQFLPKVRRSNYVLGIDGDNSVEVQKVHGCCLLLRMDFIRQIGYFDEGVFLYCEESILAAQVRALEASILYVPAVRAVHAHISAVKGRKSPRMLKFIKSRRYYLKTHSRYGAARLCALELSYALLSVCYVARAKIYEWSRGHG